MGLFGFGEIETIVDSVNELPDSGITVMSLKALDFIAPGQWRNYTNFDEMLREISGEEDEEFLGLVKNRVIELYNDKSEGYQSAMRLYRLVDKTDKALGASAFADKISQKVSILSFLDYLTPKADTSQVIDLSLKLIAELLAFTKINGIPGDSVGDFISALADYAGESKIRMAALTCFDGLVPLGPDVINYCLETVNGLTQSDLEDNDTFSSMSDDIPGDDNESKIGFIQRGVESTKDWMNNLISDYDLTPERIISSLQEYVDIADDKLDYLAAFLDMFTNYFEHTGTQTLAIRLIERSINEV